MFNIRNIARSLPRSAQVRRVFTRSSPKLVHRSSLRPTLRRHLAKGTVLCLASASLYPHTPDDRKPTIDEERLAILTVILDPSESCRVARDDELLRNFKGGLPGQEASILRAYRNDLTGRDRAIVLYLPKVEDFDVFVAIAEEFKFFVSFVGRVDPEEGERVDVWSLCPAGVHHSHMTKPPEGQETRIVVQY